MLTKLVTPGVLQFSFSYSNIKVENDWGVFRPFSSLKPRYLQILDRWILIGRLKPHCKSVTTWALRHGNRIRSGCVWAHEPFLLSVQQEPSPICTSTSRWLGTLIMNKSIISYLYRFPSRFSAAWDGTAVLSAVRVHRQNPVVTSRIGTKSLPKHCLHTVHSLFTRQTEGELLRVHEKRTHIFLSRKFSENSWIN
jgi:hypothetical protein